MRGLNLILFAMIALTLASCGKDKEANESREDNPNYSEKPGDLTKLPLDQALNAKYEQLRFKCDYELVLIRPDAIGGVSKTVLNKQFYIWDLLNDFNKQAELELDYTFENVHFKIVWNVEVGMVKQAKPGEENKDKGPAYQLVDAVVLTGSSVSKIIEYNEKGEFQGSGGEQFAKEVFYDRVPETINKNFNYTKQVQNNNYSVTCMLDAKVRPGYESDFQVVKK